MYFSQILLVIICLKGQCHKIFPRVFFMILTHPGLLFNAEVFSHMVLIIKKNTVVKMSLTSFSQTSRCH